MGFVFDSPFYSHGKGSIIQPKDLGIVNGHMTVGTPQTSVAAVAGMYAPPFASSDFSFDVRFMGEIVKAEEWDWLPDAIWRAGRVNGVRVETVTALPRGKRAAVMAADLTNETDEETGVFVQVWLKGGLDYVHQWEFDKPVAVKAGDLHVADNAIRKVNNDKAWCVGTDMPGMKWFGAAGLWETRLTLAPFETRRVFFDMALGQVEEAVPPEDREADMASAFDWLAQRTEELFDRLPRLGSDDERLVRYYDRSVMHYITNRWTVKDFLLDPYYANGSVNGGCLCCYLWDYSGGWSLHPLADPETDKKQIRQFLHIDLSRSFAFTPVDGAAYGPWYPINQEKIIALVYYYVKNTGDTDFLREELDGRTILEHVLEQAWLKDDPQRDVTLCDYGVDGEHHLELRRGIPYHGVLPDLNARRYMSYICAAELVELTGGDGTALRECARQLKRLIREALWDEEAKWFRFVAGGRADLRYTVQMFKLIGSPVLDEDMLDGLMSHWNEEEFLSEYGLHSMSKRDDAYDQVDIDNGGGGICTLFPQLIEEKLYGAGRPDEANDLLLRTLWWADRMPYWGDSFCANAIEYRQDTPYQCAIGAVSGAQALIFGLAGIRAEFDGTVTVTPAVRRPAKRIALRGVRLRGRKFDVCMGEDGFSVCADGKIWEGKYGQTVTLN